MQNPQNYFDVKPSVKICPHIKKQAFEYMYTIKLLGKNVASSKNGKRIVRGRLINSKLAMEYYDFVIPKLEEKKEEILDYLKDKDKPYRFHFYYIRKDHRHFDYSNVVQILADAFQKTEILEDDDMNNFIPVFDGYEVNKENPGVIINIE